MKKYFLSLCLSLLFSLVIAQTNGIIPEYSKAGFYKLSDSGREVYDFNLGWKFSKGALENAEATNFDDSNWEIINTPHGLELNPSEASGSSNYQGEAWYRKHFTLPHDIENKNLRIHFEAVMGKCKVWLNGELLSSHFGGYLPFSIDVSKKILKGEKNTIAVWADNSDDPNYPPGKKQNVLDFTYFGGIYRDVWLVATDNIYITNPNNVNKIAGGGLFVRYENLSAKSVNVVAKVNLNNVSENTQVVHVKCDLKNSKDSLVASSTKTTKITLNNDVEIEQVLTIKNPELWSPKKPTLYNLEISLIDENQIIKDGIKQKIGIRKIEFRGKEGFFLNNKPYDGKLMGVNRHQEFAYVGNALPNSGQWRDALTLKNAGCEIIRSAHYPADPAFMDACDALGMFFIVATPGWQFWNDENPDFEEHVYHDVRNMIRRDRNHPSVLLWEPILNETHYPEYFARKVHDIVHQEYPYEGAFAACDSRAVGMENFDVIYMHPQYADNFKIWKSDTILKKQMKFDYSNENRCVFTREWGDNVDDWHSHNSTSRVARQWGEAAQLTQAMHYANTEYRFTNWESIYSTPKQHVGGTLWHSFDHQRGYHPDPFYGGIADVFRQAKYSYYLFKSQRKPEDGEPMIYIAHEMTPFSSPDITIFSNCEEVRLIVLQKDTLEIKQDKRNYNMPSPVIVFDNKYNFMDIKSLYRNRRHSEATLVAEGLIDGKVVVRTIKKPANRIAKIKLEIQNQDIPLCANGSDFVTIIASIVDENGTVKRLNNNYINFTIEGEGNIIGDKDIMANPRLVEWGTAPSLVRATNTPGEIKITATLVNESINGPLSGEISFSSLPYSTPCIYDELSSSLTTPPKGVNSDDSFQSVKKKVQELEKKLSKYNLLEVQKQQEEFEEINN